MNSAELNEELRKIVDEPELYGYEAFGGKAVPYIGWYWRDVDFDSPGPYAFGVLPVYEGTLDDNDKPRAGFMENNKWGYEYVTATPEQWAHIKELLVAVVNNPGRDTLAAADAAIQALLPQGPST